MDALTDVTKQGKSRLVSTVVAIGLVVLVLGLVAYRMSRPAAPATALGTGRPAGVSAERIDFAAAIQSAPADTDFVLCAVNDSRGNLYLGTEDKGLHRYDAATKAWQQFMPATSGIGEDTVTALLADKSGRIWAGHLSHGVSVFNGQTWKNYDAMTGPLGGRVWAMALAPGDGSVWIATDIGLARYTPATDAWSYYTRADGLPCDEFSSLAFGSDGTLYAGTQCHGIVVGGAGDGYRSWRHITGSPSMPNTPVGTGLPSSLINCMLVSSTGTIYAGTPCGLAWSTDHGETWSFVRGMNWRANLAGQYVAVPAQGDDYRAILAEDWVTALAEDTDGQIRIGYYREGQEILDPGVSAVIRDVSVGGYATKFFYTLPGDSGSVAGIYGIGARWLAAKTPAHAALEVERSTRDTIAHPSPAKAPGAEELRAMLQRVERLPDAASVVGFIGDDWGTLGDWICRYGRQRAVLCGAQNPMDHDYGHPEAYDFRVGTGRTGPFGGAWSWLQGEVSDNPRWLYDPCVNTRRIGEWNDGSFNTANYPPSREGPDLWLQVDVPAGVHRVSLYFLNKDGHTDANQYRDFVIQVRKFTPVLEEAIDAPVLAQTRVRDFWNGVYKQLVLTEGSYWIKIQRNGSFVTIVNGLFFDRLQGPASQYDSLPRVGMGSCMYSPPELSDEKLIGPDEPSSQIISAAVSLVRGLDRAYVKQDSISFQKPYRILALRAAESAGANGDVLANWRWAIPLWTQQDRAQYTSKMAEAQESMAGKLTRLKGKVTRKRNRPGQQDYR